MKTDDDGHPYTRAVTVSEFRRHLARYIARVRFGDDFVAVHRRGEDPVFLISQADFDLLEERRTDLDVGPYDPERKGRWAGIMKFLRDDKTYQRRKAQGLQAIPPR